ncbi:MAG: pentapeptide repeat-containing protein, partial [Planctomycetaceae bacterium]|nr:pentapeptide repeat-containing protein [Planctomycetaceae bacterium]
YGCSFRGCNFTRAVIGGVDFHDSDFTGVNLEDVEFCVGGDGSADYTVNLSQVKGLTLQQIKQTNNYRKCFPAYTAYDGDTPCPRVKLPSDIQKALDEERKQKDKDKKQK